MRKYKLILAVVALFSLHYAKAQSTDNNNKNYLPNIIPPSPEAYKLGTYGNVPVGLFTGVSQLKVPIYTYKTSNLELPIYLFYGSNGLKVDEFETPTGLGWTLNSAGVISRVIRDLPDEKRSSADYQLPSYAISPQNPDFNLFCENVGRSTRYDSEPDIYNFSFGSYSGKFIFDNSGQIMLIPQQNLKVEKIQNSDRIISFKIISPEGIEYLFNEQEKTLVEYNSVEHNLVVSAWRLSKITHPKGDEIRIGYIDVNYAYNAANSQTNLSGHVYTEACNQRVLLAEKNGDILANYRFFDSKHISSISTNETDYNKILFSYSSITDEISPAQLDQITAYEKDNKVLEKVTFTYSKTYNERLFLNKIEFLDPTKVYSFEYINKELFPKRLDKGQDHWGYYNGKQNSQLIPEIGTVYDLTYTPGANKNPDFNFAKTGMLSKIKYPTKGNSEFEYEQNDYYGQEEKIVRENKNLSIGQNSNTYSSSLSFLNSISQTVKINTFLTTDSFLCPNLNSLPKPLRAFVQLIDQNGNIIRAVSNQAEEITVNYKPTLYYILEPNTTYTLKLEFDEEVRNVSLSCFRFALSFALITEKKYVMNNIPTGGIRIKSITDTDNNKKNYKRYFYATKNSLNKSSGVFLPTPLYFDVRRFYYRCPEHLFSPVFNVNAATISSSSIDSAFSELPPSEYSNVTISYGDDNFSNGGEEHEFIISLPGSSNSVIIGQYIFSCPLSNSNWSNGLERKINYFNKSNQIVKTIENSYFRDDSRTKECISFAGRSHSPLTDPLNPTSTLDISIYSTFSLWHFLKSKKETIFNINGQDPIIKTTTYMYNNSNHLQLTNEVTTNSKDETIETKLLYAHDKGNDLMINANMTSIPLETQTLKNGQLLSKQETVYAKDATTNNLLLPKTILAAKGTQTPETKITYNSYDDKGNVTQYTPEGGIPVAVIWGYNQTVPIAKIENASYAQVQSYVSNLQTLSNGTDENALIVALNSLRTNLPAAMVTTYTHKPLVGVSTITDAKGNKVTYTYDSFNRLESVKDHQGNTINENTYNYRPN